MLTRAAFGLAIVLASVSGSLAGDRPHAVRHPHAIHRAHAMAGVNVAPRPANSDTNCWKLLAGFSCN